MHSQATMEKPETRGRKKLRHLEIRPAQNGGHMVTHHFADADANYSEPATHVFGPDQGKEMMAHISKHANVAVEDNSK